MAHKCIKQHIVPCFVIGSFNYESCAHSRRNNRVYILNDSGKIESRKAASNKFAANKIYSPLLDLSWTYYESDAYKVLDKIADDAFDDFGLNEIRINAKMAWHSVMPYLAGMIARVNCMPRIMRESKFNDKGQLSRSNNDFIRVIIFEMVLSALMSANIKILRSLDSVLPSNGCIYDSSSRSLLFPIKPSVVLVVSWDNESHFYKPSIMQENQDIIIPIVDIDDGMVLNKFITGKSTKYVISGRLAVLNGMIEDGVLPGDDNCNDLLDFIDFMAGYFPIFCIRDWVDQILILIDKKEFMNYDRNDPIQVALIFQMIKNQYGFWAPPVIVKPYIEEPLGEGAYKQFDASRDGRLVKEYDSYNMMDCENNGSIKWRFYNERLQPV